MKVQELAKNLGQDLRSFIQFLRDVDVRAKSGSTKLDPQTVALVKELFEESQKKEAAALERQESRPSQVSLSKTQMTVSELVKILEVTVPEMMKAILEKGLLLNLNSQIDQKAAIDIAAALTIELIPDDDLGDSVSNTEIKEKLHALREVEDSSKSETLSPRPPIITIMGHVDHGKTQLLDTIRTANVVSKEAGGITQHIGAYQVAYKGHTLTFLDTPGHEAFTSLRARGAQVTDLTILVVAADDGVKPQTIEAINHAKAAEVPIIVAINKIDKPEADIDQVKQQLSQYELMSEDWGGKTIMVPISAKENKGIDDLLEMLLLESELLELRADATCLAKGVIIEAKLTQGKGPVATVLVNSGTLKRGDCFVIGHVFGKVRALINDAGEKVSVATPGTPVELMGITTVPDPGEILEVFSTEKEAKSLAESRRINLEKDSRSTLKTVSLETLSKQIESGVLKTLNLIVKTDVHGSLEAIVSSIQKIDSDDVAINVIHAATGAVSENDIALARASSAFIINFGPELPVAIRSKADAASVTVKSYDVIYKIFDDIKRAIEGFFDIEYVESEIGVAEVRNIFPFSKVGAIAGCMVNNGKILRNARLRVMRSGEEVFDGEIDSLKRFKEDVKEVASGYECGIVLDGFHDFKELDLLHCYTITEKEKTL